ncbi:MAG TPA: MarR family transcriptional regulator [Nocardioidaceae bacterium]|nr:MarR family transcriptional regulator [Nocardioidaceae bacterium]
MSTTAPAKPSTDLLFLFAQASQVLTSELTAALAELGISQRTYCVLSKAAEEEMTQGQLAERCLLDKTTMVVTLDELEKLGYAERQMSTTDRRARVVAVTAKGRRVVTAASEIVTGIYDDVLAALPASERAAVVAGLTHLVEGRLSSPTPCEHLPRRRRAAG